MSTTKPTYHLGLCMAGAISAGAYTAGVMDYLFETLENWERAKKNGIPEKNIKAEDIPQHNVLLDVMGGASAGGITSGLGALAAFKNFAPINKNNRSNPQALKENLFYETWVNLLVADNVDMFKVLLGTDDLKDNKIHSALNAKFIADIATKTVAPGIAPDSRRSYVQENLQLIVTLSNLNGIPYQVNYQSDSTRTNPQYIYNYRDFGHFVVNPTKDMGEGIIEVDTKDPNADLTTMRQAMMATGAFPVGLMSRIVRRKTSVIQNNALINQLKGKKAVLTALAAGGDTEVAVATATKPADTELAEAIEAINREIAQLELDEITTINADGGMLNNEPFEIVEGILATTSGQNNADRKDKNKTLSGIFMIDPFPTQGSELKEWSEELKGQSKEENQSDYNDLYTIENIVGKLLSALRSQPLFKKDDIVDAYNSEDFSKYIIAPTLTNRAGEKLYGSDAIACGTLYGFGGFLEKKFRVHDFILGRYNCQRFLQHHFALPVDSTNPIVAGYSDEMKKHFAITDDKGRQFIPIIPDVNRPLNNAEERINIIIDGFDASRFKSEIKTRVKALISNVGFFSGFVSWIANLLVANKITDKVITTINNNVRKHRLFK